MVCGGVDTFGAGVDLLRWVCAWIDGATRTPKVREVRANNYLTWVEGVIVMLEISLILFLEFQGLTIIFHVCFFLRLLPSNGNFGLPMIVLISKLMALRNLCI